MSWLFIILGGALSFSAFLVIHSRYVLVLLQIFDIVNQIIPSAYLLDTSYWIFYSSMNGLTICLCHRFGIRCPHLRGPRHWLNMSPIPGAVGGQTGMAELYASDMVRLEYRHSARKKGIVCQRVWRIRLQFMYHALKKIYADELGVVRSVYSIPIKSV